jgi:hypothetical protein
VPPGHFNDIGLYHGSGCYGKGFDFPGITRSDVFLALDATDFVLEMVLSINVLIYLPCFLAQNLSYDTKGFFNRIEAFRI